jgi:hypothetical protein
MSRQGLDELDQLLDNRRIRVFGQGLVKRGGCGEIIWAAQRLALAAGRTGKTPPQTSTIASKPAPYHQGEALSAARCVGLF